MGGYLCKAATSEVLRKEVFRLRSEGYAAELKGTTIVFPDRYDDQENCRSYVLTRPGEAAGLGTIRPCVFDPGRPDLSIPVFELYRDEVAASLGRDSALVQSTHFAISPALRGGGFLPKLLLFREVYRTAIQTRARFVITVVRNKESYVHFYGKLGFMMLAEGRIHPTFVVPTALLAVEITEERFRRVLATERFASIFREIPPPTFGGEESP